MKARSFDSDSEGSFDAKVEEIDEDVLWNMTLDMVFALKHVHDSGFVHLDIKPSNFFVCESGTVKLGDFGMAQELSNLDNVDHEDVEGDCIYLAPEMLDFTSRPSLKASFKSDIFSLGATILEIATGVSLPKNGPVWQKLREGNI